MTITITQNKNIEFKQEILNLKRDSKREFALKTLLSLALVVIGVVAILFLSKMSMGIGLILLGGLAAGYYIYHYRHSNQFFNRAANAIASLQNLIKP